MISDGVHAVLESTGEYGKFYQYLTDILIAIKNTSTIYYRRDNGKTSESGFATEFLHQLRCFSDCKCKLGNRLYEGLIINGETTKMKEGYLDMICRAIDDYYEKKKVAKRNRLILAAHHQGTAKKDRIIKPDFIIHEPDTLNRQECYGEIKMESNGETVSDLVKISEWETLLEDAFSSDEYLEHGLDPRFGLYIFIYVYKKDVKIDKSLKARIKRSRIYKFSLDEVVDTKKRLKYQLQKDIICISVGDDYERDVGCETLGEILNKIYG